MNQPPTTTPLHRFCDVPRRELGRRLRRAREISGLSVPQAAHRLGMRRLTLARYESDGPPLLSSQLLPFAEQYGVRLEWLRGDQVTPPPALTDLALRLAAGSALKAAEITEDLMATVGPLAEWLPPGPSGASTSAGSSSV